MPSESQIIWATEVFFAGCCGALYTQGRWFLAILMTAILILVHFMDLLTGGRND